MKISKRLVPRSLLVVEIIIFSWAYISGTQGLRSIWHYESENSLLQNRIADLEKENDTLEHELLAWNTYPFYKEKIAREQLQMARATDTIYYLT